MQSVRAWSEQSGDPASYEIIALAPGEDTQTETAVRPLLRPGDRWIERPGRDEYELFEVGANLARGEFLFLTEAHCVPESDCVQAILEELDRTGAPGVRGASIPDVRGPLGELELEMFEKAQRAEEDPTHWRKVLIHSLALRRDIFVEAGGTPSRYGDFCTWVLAIELDRLGWKPAYSPRPRVRHTYDGDPDHIRPFVRSFRRGEVLYRTERLEERLDSYLEWVPEWEGRLEFTRAGALEAVRATLALRHRGTLATAARHALVALAGSRVAIASARRRAALAARRLRRAGSPEALRAAFIEYWAENSRCGTLEGLAEFNPPAPQQQPADRIDLVESVAGRVIGLHDPELDQGVPPFRWTEPLALLHVAVPASNRVHARLELHPFERPPEARPADLRLAVDRRVVPIRVSDQAVEFEIDPGEHWIALACNALHPGSHGVDDPRRLGIPVRSLSFETT